MVFKAQVTFVQYVFDELFITSVTAVWALHFFVDQLYKRDLCNLRGSRLACNHKLLQNQ